MQKSFDVTGPVVLEVKLASGEIEIDASLEGRAEVELIAHDEESQRLVDAARVELAGDRLLVDVPQRRGGFSLGLVFGRHGITCRVRCPEGSGVTARTKSADILVRGTIDGLDVQTASGDVEAGRVEAGANVKSASGDVRIGTVGRDLSVQTASGDVEVDAVHGAVSIAGVSGDVVIREASGNVSVNTVSGDQEHGAVVAGKVAAQSVSGDVRIGVRRGSRVYLDCNSVSGDTSSELELTGEPPAGDGPLVEIRAKTVSGDIRIVRAPAPVGDTQEVHA